MPDRISRTALREDNERGRLPRRGAGQALLQLSSFCLYRTQDLTQRTPAVTVRGRFIARDGKVPLAQAYGLDGAVIAVHIAIGITRQVPGVCLSPWPSGREERMRKTLKAAAVGSGMAVVFTLAGCGADRDPSAMTADLERDLQLATVAELPRTAVVSALEGGPTGARSGDMIGRREAVPTARRSVRPMPSAAITETVSNESVDETPDETLGPATVATERVKPTPASSAEPGVQAPPDLSTEAVTASGPTARGDDDAGRDRGRGGGNVGDGNGNGGRRGGGWGGIIGVVIRGGGAGDDHCEEHDRRRNGGRNGGRIGTRVGGNGGIIGTVIGEVIDRGRAPVGTPQRWPRY